MAETKITNAIYKIVKTTNDDFALATSTGLKFAKLSNDKK